MKLKTIKIIGVFGIFITSFIVHFIYNIFPNILVSIFFPVNESIFEHMKILFTSTLLYGIIDYYLLVKNKIDFHNFRFQLFFTAFISVIIYLILYLPLFKIFRDNFIVAVGLMLVVYAIGQYISYNLLKDIEYRFVNDLAIPFIIICYILFFYFTYNPPENYLFYDFSKNKYGINDFR